METLTHNMNKWTTDELRGVEGVIIQARLAEKDRQFGAIRTPAQLRSGREEAGVEGTIEMGLAEGAN